MDESRLTTIAQIEDFLSASASIAFKPDEGDCERYARISAVLKRFDYPRPNGRVGYVRIDTVHQGDLDGIEGVYHITCVDAVSQWQLPFRLIPGLENTRIA